MHVMQLTVRKGHFQGAKTFVSTTKVFQALAKSIRFPGVSDYPKCSGNLHITRGRTEEIKGSDTEN